MNTGNKKLLIICDENPFPVRDGISAAISSFVVRVEKEYSIYYYIKNSFFRFKDLNYLELEKVDCSFDDFKVYATSPILPSFKHVFKLPEAAIKIALLSDCYTFVLWTNIRLAIRFGYVTISSFKDVLKIPIYYLIELIISRKFDHIFLQTPRDVSIFKKLFFSKKATDLPNITISKKELKYTTLNERSDIGWVASFESSYLKIAEIFFDKTLVKVLSKKKNCKVHFLGKGNKDFVSALSNKYPLLKEQLIAEPFCPDLKDFYLKRKIIVSPVFKNYGLINKTIESLTYGCVTIGDIAAFNGLQGFVSGTHGFIAESFEEFVKVIEEKNNKVDETISLNAISLIEEFNKEKLYPKNLKKIFKL